MSNSFHSKMEPKLTNAKGIKTYLNTRKYPIPSKAKISKDSDNKSLTTKDAVRFLLQGTLKWRVCRFCLIRTTSLSELDEVLEVGSSGATYQVTIREMIVSFYPFQMVDDPNFPNKICSKCLDRTINSYLFTQQCERAERALRNCFNDINEKFDKLDPLERIKRRGRQKLNPNHNVLHAEFKTVMSYADPIINIVNAGASRETDENTAETSEYECPKCWQVLPNLESYMNHEKIHPKSMWYNCRHCGKSFVKHSHYKKHMKECQTTRTLLPEPDTKKRQFSCTECGTFSEEFGKHLQHMEKHKFKIILEHLIERRMNELCGVCMAQGEQMVELNETFHLHGGYPELTGEKTLAKVLKETVPEMNTINNYVGTKICQSCLNHALSSYIFLKKIKYTRTRLETCVSLMLENLENVEEPKKNVMVEIAEDSILPLTIKEEEELEQVALDDSDIDESKLKIEVLEDEFRIESDSSDESSNKSDFKSKFDELKKTLYPVNQMDFILDNPAKDATRTYTNRKLVNGFQPKLVNHEIKKPPPDDICSEFLTFKKKPKPTRRRLIKFTCPLCSKHFISDYFLKKHMLKHINMKVKCPVCLKQLNSKFRLFEHIKMEHIAGDIKFDTCTVCARGFANSKKLQAHKKTHYAKQCQLCDKLFSTQSRFDNHLQRHAMKFNTLKNFKSQTCSFCEKECSNENELSLHVNKSHLQIKPYSCDMCDKQFYTEPNLSSHKWVHEFHSKEKCEFCAKEFKCRKDLVVHVRKHIGSKPHNCHVCRQSFYSESGRNAHMKRVHGGRLCCRLCKSMFNRKLDLKAHVNVAHNAM